MEENKKHRMQTACQLTGLSPHVIRVWEKRYQAVSPARTETKRRYYSELEIERLQLLKKLTDKKYRISKVAQLPLEELRKISSLAEKAPPPLPETYLREISPEIFENCLAAVENLDTRKLGIYIARASLSLSTMTFMERFIAPLIQELWKREREGRFRPVQVQGGWLVIRSFLVNLANIYDVPDNAPPLIVAAPAGQYFEGIPLFIQTIAAASGWRGIYIGVNLAAEEIAAGASQVGAKVITLSLGAAKINDVILVMELKKLKSLLPQNISLLAFGETMEMESLLSKIGAIPISNLSALKNKLNDLT